MTQAWAWVSSKGRVAVDTIRKERSEALPESFMIWGSSSRTPDWYSQEFLATTTRMFLRRMRSHGWHLKRVKVEPVEG